MDRLPTIDEAYSSSRREPARVHHDSMVREWRERHPAFFDKLGDTDERREATLRAIPSAGLTGEQIEAFSKRYGLSEAERVAMRRRVMVF